MVDTTKAERLEDNRIELYYSALRFTIDLPDSPEDITDEIVVSAGQELMQILNDFRYEDRVAKEEEMQEARRQAGLHTHYYFDDTQSAPKERECSCIIAQDHTDPNPYEQDAADV